VTSITEVPTVLQLSPAHAAMSPIRMDIERAWMTVSVLQMLKLPAAVLTANGRAVASNTAFDACAPQICVGSCRRIQFAALSAQARYDDARASARADLLSQGDRSFAVPGDGTSPPMVAHLRALPDIERNLSPSAALLLFFTSVVPQRAPDERLLVALFDLTAAEARVASRLVEGQSVTAIARAFGVATSTVRSQLKSIFGKTGTRRQAEIVSLLATPHCI
jgi:DNA-binding CsgD family transcriptional regulator